MAIEYAPLFALETQFQAKDGRNNTGGWLKVFLAATDDPATTYSDYSGTRNPEKIVLDDDGRAVVICDKSKAYRLEVYSIDGALLWTEEPVYCSGTGGGGVSITKVISTDGSISVDKSVAGSITTYDLSLGIDADNLKPSCLKASATPLTSDGQFVFAETARGGTLLSVDNSGKVRMEPAWYHFTATVELAYDSTPANEGRRVTLRSPLSSSVVDFDTSYAHRESIELSGDIHADAANTEFPLGVTGLGNGIRAYLVGFDIHAVTGHGGNNEYRAGEGITIDSSTRTISADFDSVQEKLVAGDNISITGNVISAGNISQEQADWTEDDTSSPAYIKHRPDLGIYATRTEVATGLAGKQDVISDLSAIRAGAAAGATALQPSDVATVATSGDYGDLSNRPDLGIYATKAEVNSGLSTKQDTISDLAQIRAGAASGSTAVQPGNLATVATTGDYDDLENRPDLGVYATRAEVNTGLAGKQDTISDLAAIRSGAQLGATSVQPADLDTYATDAELASGLATKQDAIDDLSEIRSGAAAGATAVQPADLAAVATTGDYDDLTNKPSIPTATSELANDSSFITSADVPVKDVEVDGVSVVNAQGVAEITMPDLSGYATTQALDTGLAGKQDVISDLSAIRSGAASGATAVQPGDLATVATTGSYDDLSGRPDLSVYATDSELSAGLATKQDTIPDIATIRSGAAAGATAVQPSDLAAVATSGSYEDLTDKPDLGVYATRTELTDGLAGKQDTISDLATIRSGAAAGATAVQPSDLPSVDQSYSSSSTNAQSGTAVAQAISGVDAVPDVSSSDNGKVLVANYSGGAGSYAWASTPPANAIILDSNSTWSDFHTPYSAGRKDIYYKRTSPYAPLDSRVELYLHLTAVSDVDGSSTNFTYALFEGAWQSGDVDYSIRCKFRYSGGPLVFLTSWAVDQSYSASSRNAQSGVAVAQAISTVNQVPSSTSADAYKVLTVNDRGTPEWASAQASISAGNGIDITDDVVSIDTSVVATQTDLATKQDTIGDLAAIRSGAALGATAVQPGDLPSVDQTYDAASPNAQSGTAVAGALATVSQVPSVTSSDNNKTLVSTYNDGVGSYAWAQNTFIARYGTSTYAEIKAAIDAGYNVLCLKTDSTYPNSSFAGGIGYIFGYGRRGGNIEFNYFQPFPNKSQATDANQGIAIVHIWKVGYNNTWTSSTVVVAPKIVASSPLSLSYSNDKREVTLGVSLGGTLTTANDAIEVATPLPASTSSDEGKVLTVNDQGTPEWTTAQAPISAGNGIDITNDVVRAKVDGTTVTINASGELEAAPAVTVDQTYNATSTNPQSGTAVAQAIATKEDAFDVGTGLEMDTSGSTPTLRVEAPVDIVAGPGIVIDNPDGNTLRVSTDENYEKELYVHTTVPYTDVDAVFTLSEPVTNFERIRVESWNREFQQHQATYEFTIAGSTTSTVFVMSMDHSESTSNIQRLNMRFSYNSDGNLVDKGHILFFGNGDSSAWGNQRGLGIHRVVGIHRIASN